MKSMHLAELLATGGVLLAVFGLPFAALVWLIVAIVRYNITPKENTEKRRAGKRMITVSAITAAVLNGAVITLIVLFMIDLSHM